MKIKIDQETIQKLILFSGIIDTKPLIATALRACGATHAEIAKALGMKDRQQAHEMIKRLKSKIDV